MPRATVSLDPEDKVELKTCPGGFVTLRRLSYGQKLERQQALTRTTMEVSGQRRQRNRSQKAQIDMLQRGATYYDYKNCVIDHNLEDDDGRKLDLTNPYDVDKLDPRVGEEISTKIDELNNFEEELEKDEDGEGDS